MFSTEEHHYIALRRGLLDSTLSNGGEMEKLKLSKQLEEKGEIINSLLDSSYDGIFIIDKNAKIIYLSEAIGRITGLISEKIKGKSIYKLIEKGIMHPESVSIKVFKSKKRMSSLLELKDNVILSTATPYFDKNENIKFIICNVRDINELDSLYLGLKNTHVKDNKDKRKLIYSKLQESIINMGFIDFFINSKEMYEILKLIFSLTNFDLTYLLTGETGTGKGIIAKIIHHAGKRKNGRFVEINCSAIPMELFESELFGYKEGAFSGALKTGQAGLLESANRGTVFLDEIGAMPLPLQGKLLKFLDDRRIKRLGSSQSVALDVQVISATNTDLSRDIREGKFREDLYYRLNEISINIPPLRERNGDIDVLIENYWHQYSKEYNKKVILDHEALRYMRNYRYPGNVRELKSIVKKAILNAQTRKIEIENIKGLFQKNYQPSSNFINNVNKLDYKEIMNSFEKNFIEEAYGKYNSTYAAARALNMKQSTFFRKAKKFGLL